MKKALCLLLLGALALCCAGCAKNNTDKKDIVNESSPQINDGGYTVETAIAGSIPENAKSAFNAATQNLEGVSYTPLALIGRQVVAGTNYLFLVKSDKTSKFEVLTVYEPLDASARITATSNFVLSDYLKDCESTPAKEVNVGGTRVPSEGGMTSMPQELGTATSEAFSKYENVKLEPLACLGSQVVAGTNYIMLCRGTPEGSTVSNVYVVKIYNSLDGSSSVISVCYVDLSKF